MKIVFVGSGNMASALIGGLINRGGSPGDIFAIDPDEVSRARVESQFGISTGEHIDSSIAQYDIVVLAVKPQAIKTVCSSLAPHLTDQLIISIAASIRAIDISLWLAGYARIVRAMPNTPAFIGLGVTGLAALPGVDQTTKTLASAVMEKVGKVIWFEEEAAINAVTAVSGGGPAYVFYFIEAIEEAAQQLGMSGDEARAVAVATFN